MPKEVSQMHRTHGITELVWPHVGFRPHMDVPLADKVTTGMTQKLQRKKNLWQPWDIDIRLDLHIYIYNNTVISTLLFC